MKQLIELLARIAGTLLAIVSLVIAPIEAMRLAGKRGITPRCKPQAPT